MANHKSSEKRARSSLVKKERNSNYLSSIRTAVKRAKFAIEQLKAGTEKDPTKAQALLGKAQEMLQKGASKGVIHKKNAGRRVSRLALSIKSVDKK